MNNHKSQIAFDAYVQSLMNEQNANIAFRKNPSNPNLTNQWACSATVNECRHNFEKAIIETNASDWPVLRFKPRIQ